MESNKILLVIDMQNDFLTGSLANEEGQKIVDRVEEKVKTCLAEGNPVYFTRDTHGDDYMKTQEGKNLPVEHCVKDSDGWQITDKLRQYTNGINVLNKKSFGSSELAGWLRNKNVKTPSEIEVCGVCTDICVISNAIILKAAFPETVITVDSGCCAGVTPESHETAINAMKACQINIK